MTMADDDVDTETHAGGTWRTVPLLVPCCAEETCTGSLDAGIIGGPEEEVWMVEFVAIDEAAELDSADWWWW